MSQIHKTDAYNLLQPSHSGRAGFETFLNDKDNRFYFHFNDAKGEALLFSQAYIRETDRDNVLNSVKKNALDKKRYQIFSNTEGGVFFIIRAGNKQEIARSRNYENEEQMVADISYFMSNLNLTQSIVEEKSIITKESETHPLSIQNENLALKKQIEDLENRISVLHSTLEIKGEDIAPARQVFRIELYQSSKGGRLLGKVQHVLSGEVKPFSGLDTQAIGDFIQNKLALDENYSTAIEKKYTSSIITSSPRIVRTQTIVRIPTTAPQPQTLPTVSTTTANTAELVEESSQKAYLIVKNLENIVDGVRAHQSFEARLCPSIEARQKIRGYETCRAQLFVYSFDTHERFLLLERDIPITEENCFVAVRVPPNTLCVGSYRLSLVTYTRTHDRNDTSLNKWHAEALVQVF